MRIRPSHILGIFFLFPLLVRAQNSQEAKVFDKLVYDLCLEKPLKQLEIDEIMQGYTTDLHKMYVLLKEASNKNYNSGAAYARVAIGNQFLTIGFNDIALIYYNSASGLLDEEVDPLGVKELQLHQALSNTTLQKDSVLDQLSELSNFFLTNNHRDLWAHSVLGEVAVLLDLKRTREALVLLDRLSHLNGEGDEFIQEQIEVSRLQALLNQDRFTEARNQAYSLLDQRDKISLPAEVEIQRVLVECERNIGMASLAGEYRAQLDSLELMMARETLSLLGDKTEEYLATVEQQDENLADLKDKRSRTLVIGAILILGLLGMILLNVYRQYLSDNEKKVLSLEQRMLRSQMNPHFIFNSLNSIKQFIVVNDKEKAVRYLNKFAKLMRKILDGSGKRETSLAEELETVELYLNIENMRFSNKIEINLQVDPSLNTELIKVPSLLLQPFLENAIWHGLSEKEGDKKIWIHIQRENDLRLRISVTDNGIGREMAAVRKRNRSLKRTSVGLKNTRERLGHFAENYQKDFDLEFHDLENSNGSAAGTQVVLKIPLV